MMMMVNNNGDEHDNDDANVLHCEFVSKGMMTMIFSARGDS